MDPANEESEVLENLNSILRTGMMAMMQVSEARERRAREQRERVERDEAARTAEHQASVERAEKRFAQDQHVSSVLHRESQSPSWLQTVSNKREIADILWETNKLAEKGHMAAQLAMNNYSTHVLAEYGIDPREAIKGGEKTSLLNALDDATARRGEDLERSEAKQVSLDRDGAILVNQDAQSQAWMKQASNEDIADRLQVTQELAKRGYPQAETAYNLYTDHLRDLYDVDAHQCIKDGGYEALLDALHEANGAGRTEAEAQVHENAAEEAAEEHTVAAEAQEEKYSEELRQAATAEAEQADLPVETYLDSLDEAQHEAIMRDAAEGTEDSLDREDRIEHARETAGMTEVDTTSSAEQDSHELQAETARDEASDHHVAESAKLHEAAENLPHSDYQVDMDRHLKEVAQRDPQAAEARRVSVQNIPNEGKGYVGNSVQASSNPSKGKTRTAKASREATHQR